MFDSTATLYSRTVTTDELLNEVTTYTPREVFVRKVRSVRMSEFYAANAAGLKPSVVLVVFFGDYGGEAVVGWDGRIYTVTRTYRTPDSDDLEITLEEHLEHIDGIEEGGGNDED